ncbi:MAG: hypothetical protein QG671_1611, partial [Actinomycetota bacterium]|nr:hypothetical protein [Actinomycetota bacterium]
VGGVGSAETVGRVGSAETVGRVGSAETVGRVDGEPEQATAVTPAVASSRAARKPRGVMVSGQPFRVVALGARVLTWANSGARYWD